MRFDLAIIVLVQAWASNAHATPVTTIDWGLLDPIESALIRPKGKVDDFVLFAVTQATTVLSSAESNQIDARNGRKGGTVYLFRDLRDAFVGSYEFGDESDDIAHEFALLPGNYYYRIVSTGPGASGGAFTFSSSSIGKTALLEASPNQVNNVSEPKSYALLLGGLAAVGWFTKRRTL